MRRSGRGRPRRRRGRRRRVGGLPGRGRRRWGRRLGRRSPRSLRRSPAGGRGRAERRPRRCGNAGDVLGGDPLQCLTGAQRPARVGSLQQLGQLSHGAFAQPWPRALERGDELVGQWRRLDDHASRAVRNRQVALSAVGPEGRGLPGLLAPHGLVGIVVELADGDQTVAVAIGLAAAQPLHQRRGEDGGDAVADDVAVLEGVLGAARAGEDDPPPSLEAVAQGQLALALGALREGAAVAAVEDEDLAATAAVLELFVEPGGWHGGGGEKSPVGVGAGVVEPAAVVEHSMTGEVDEGQIAGPDAGAEAGDLAPQRFG